MNQYEKEIVNRAIYITKVTSPVLGMGTWLMTEAVMNGRISERQAAVLNAAFMLENKKVRKKYFRKLNRMLFWNRVKDFFRFR